MGIGNEEAYCGELRKEDAVRDRLLLIIMVFEMPRRYEFVV